MQIRYEIDSHHQTRRTRQDSLVDYHVRLDAVVVIDQGYESYLRHLSPPRTGVQMTPSLLFRDASVLYPSRVLQEVRSQIDKSRRATNFGSNFIEILLRLATDLFQRRSRRFTQRPFCGVSAILDEKYVTVRSRTHGVWRHSALLRSVFAVEDQAAMRSGCRQDLDMR